MKTEYRIVEDKTGHLTVERRNKYKRFFGGERWGDWYLYDNNYFDRNESELKEWIEQDKERENRPEKKVIWTEESPN